MNSVRINRYVTATVTFSASGGYYSPKRCRLAVKNPRGVETSAPLSLVSPGVYRGRFKATIIGTWTVKGVSDASGEEAETAPATFLVVTDGF